MRGNKMKGKFLSILLGGGLFFALQGIVWAAEGGAHGHELNWTDFALRLMNFGILVVILVKLLKKPAGSFLSSRREDIKKQLAELELKKQEAEKKSSEYTAKLALLDTEAKKIMDEMISDGEAERQKIIDAAQKQAEYIRQQAQLAVQQEIKAARESLQEEISELSVSAAEDLLKKNLKAQDQERLVREFMGRVVEAK
jgi:F-type H+-transporting ATPase subunit b